jgi:hypothetical protein
MEREILKKSQCLLCQRNEISFDLIDRLKKAHPVKQLCTVLDVCKSSYYYWHHHQQATPRRLGLAYDFFRSLRRPPNGSRYGLCVRD